MFSFFKKKKDPFTVRIKEYEQPRFVAGMQTPTAKRSYRKDVSALQTSFNGKRDQLQNLPTDLPLKMAKAKKYFFHTWLPSSGYKMLDGIESCELYDRRSKIALPSMELIFPLQSKQ